MFSKKNIVMFFAGASTFHTLSHIVMATGGFLPVNYYGFTITPLVNFWAIIMNAVISGVLLWWASTLKK